MIPQDLLEATAHEDRDFQSAALSIVCGAPEQLREQLSNNPNVAKKRSRSEHGATLWHYVSANAIEDVLQLHPSSIYQQLIQAPPHERPHLEQRLVETIQVLSASSAEVDAIADGYGGGRLQTPINWLVSSDHPDRAGVMQLAVRGMLNAGASIDGLDNDSSPVTTALLFGKPSAVKELVQAGARIDNLILAAAAGSTELVSQMLESENPGDVSRLAGEWFKPPSKNSEIIDWAMVFAAMCNHPEMIRIIANHTPEAINCMPTISHMTATPLHTACLAGNAQAAEALMRLFADPSIVEPRYESTAIGWARQCGEISLLQKIGHYTAEYLRKAHDSRGVSAFRAAVNSGEVQKVRAAVTQHALTPAQLNGPWFSFDTPAVVQAKNTPEIVQCLVEQGADINQKSHWWAGGFGILHETDERLADKYLLMGANLDAWSAASLGRLESLRALIDLDPELIIARGPDGMLPLHCAATTQIAEFLIDLGAPLDARCLDHNSTALQYAVGKNDDVARLLIDRGCETDIFAAATIGIPELIESTLDSQPDAIAAVVDRNHFPSPAADCIYSWTIGWFATPHMAASKAGQEDALAVLWKRSPPAIELLNACLLNDETRMKRLTSEGCAGGEAAESCQSFVAHSARNNNHVAVRNLLQCGFDPKATGQHGATALHWAAFHGNVQMLLETLKHTDDLSAKDADYDCTPLQWARQGVMAGWHKDTGDFASVAKLLLEAGSPRDDNATPTGNAEFDNVYS